MKNWRSVGTSFACIAILAVSSAPAMADETGTESTALPAVEETFTPQEVKAALTPADGGISQREDTAVEQYLDIENEANGTALEPQDLEVGTLTTGDLALTVVAPEAGLSVGAVTVNSADTPGEISVGAQTASETDGLDATDAGPTMGAWPSWTNSWHASVRYRIYKNSDYLGDGVFQTYKRRMQSDGSSSRDYWQVSRYAIGRPAQWNGYGPDGPMTVAKLWASQNLTVASHNHAQEWMWNLTKPEEGFSHCSGGVSVTAGPFTFTPSNCVDYDVWTGAIGHQRMNMDQGSWAGNGQRAFAYVTAFSMDNGYAPSFTWYEFVTLRIGPQGPDAKCADTGVGSAGGTETSDCRWS